MNDTKSSPFGTRRTQIAIAAILVVGALSAALILRSGPDSSSAKGAGGQGHSEAASHADTEHHGEKQSGDHKDEKGHADGEHHDEKEQNDGAKSAEKKSAEGAHDDDEGLIQMDSQRMQAAGIRTAEVGSATVRSVLQLPGEIRFNEDKTAHVVPRVPGVVDSVPANLGQVVKKGQLLAVLSSAAVSEQRSELQAASQRLALARTSYAREQKLWEEKVSAEQDYLQARQTLREAEIAVSNAQQKLAANGAEAGQETTQVFTISDVGSVWAEMRVAASDLPAVKVGEKATVKATAFSSSATGVVAYVGALIGQETRTAPARITLENPEGAWRPGLFVNVELTASSQQVPVAVASSAIQRLDGQNSVVFVPVKGGFRAQPVRVGRSDPQTTEILEGLKSGQSYVTEGSFMLKAELGKATAEHAH